MSTQTEIAHVKTGDWTPYYELTDEDQQIFDQATIGLSGVKHIPLKISIIPSDESSCRYKCISINAVENLVWEAFVEIKKTLGGNPDVYMILPTS